MPSGPGGPPGDPAPVSFDAPVTIVGGGALRRRTLECARALAPDTVAADGGADRLRDWGVPAAAVIGDMDSIRDLGFWQHEEGCRVLRLEEQDSTDLEKCLRLVRAPLLLAVGFLGSRLDHSFAAFAALGARGRRMILLGGEDLAFSPPSAWSADLPTGARLSILALRSVRIEDAAGLRWPPAGLEIGIGTGRGISNVVAAESLRLSFDRPGAVVVTEREHLAEIVRSLL